MSNKRKFALLAGGLVALLGFQAASVVAQEDGAQEAAPRETAAQESDYTREDESRNPFSFWASQSFYHDNNIYRLSDDYPKALTPKEKRGDSFSVTRVGVSFDGVRSRQAFHAGLSMGKTLYRTHSNLNSTSWDGDLRWDWRVGDRWSGIFGYSNSQQSVDLGNTYGVMDRVTRRIGRANASADFWWHPNWATGVGFSDVRNDYRDNARPYDKYDAQEASLNFTYRPSTGNRVVLSFRAEEGQYPNREKKQGSMREWERRDARLSAQWQLTGVTRLNGYVGYTQRKYDLAPNRDFSGATGKIEFHWVPTGKAIIDLAWRREIGADADAVSNFAVTQGWSLRPTWVVTSKVRLGASFEYLDRDYRGDPGLGSEALPRDSKTTSYGVNFLYQPVPRASIRLDYQHQKRDAKNLDHYDYSARTVWLSGNLTF